MKDVSRAHTPNFGLDNGPEFRTGSGENPHGRFSGAFPVLAFVSFACKLSLTPDQTQAMLAHLPKWDRDGLVRDRCQNRGQPQQGPNAADDAVSAGGTVPSCGSL